MSGIQNTDNKWIFIRVNDGLALAKVTKGLSTIDCVYKLLDEDRLRQFQISSKELLKASTKEEGLIDTLQDIYTILSEESNAKFESLGSKMFLSIQRKDSSEIVLEVETSSVDESREQTLLHECTGYLMKNAVVGNHIRTYISHLALEKDRAIEFLGNTAKDYGASNTILKWAPVNSPNYKSLMKFDPSLAWAESFPNGSVNLDIIDLNELNEITHKSAAVSIRSYNKDKDVEEEEKTTGQEIWDSNVGESNLEDDSLLAQFNLDESLKLTSSSPVKLKVEDDSILDVEIKNQDNHSISDSESATDIEYESPRKRSRHEK